MSEDTPAPVRFRLWAHEIADGKLTSAYVYPATVYRLPNVRWSAVITSAPVPSVVGKRLTVTFYENAVVMDRPSQLMARVEGGELTEGEGTALFESSDAFEVSIDPTGQ